MPIDPSAATVTLVASIEPATQLVFLKAFISGVSAILGLGCAGIFAVTWRG